MSSLNGLPIEFALLKLSVINILLVSKHCSNKLSNNVSQVWQQEICYGYVKVGLDKIKTLGHGGFDCEAQMFSLNRVYKITLYYWRQLVLW